MPIKWFSLIADDAGTIDYVRVRALVSVMLALLGGAVMVAGAAMEIIWKTELPISQMMLAAGALVLPLTGGKVADALANRGK